VSAKETFVQVKSNVWKWDLDGKEYSVKKYESIETVYKLKKIHESLTAISFPYTLPILQVNEENTIVQPWIKSAKTANYSMRKDRQSSLQSLQALHQTIETILWEEMPYLKRFSLKTKWEERLERFKSNRFKLASIIGEYEVEKIIDFAEKALLKIKKECIEPRKLTLLHGDVVHHNVLKSQNGDIYLIDFDLACLGPSDAESALWMHRVLPHVDYNIAYLLEEQPTLIMQEPTSMFYLLFPNELLREWLYILTLPSHRQKLFIPKLKLFTAKALTLWPKLWYDIESL
jgi:hypothetical protein